MSSCSDYRQLQQQWIYIKSFEWALKEKRYYITDCSQCYFLLYTYYLASCQESTWLVKGIDD